MIEPPSELTEWVDDTRTTGLLVQVGSETLLEINRPEPRAGWYGIDGQVHHGPTSEAIGLPFEPLADGRMRQDVASAQKSVVAILVAVALDRGLLTFDDPVTDHLGLGWSRADPDHEAEVTIRHLMTMTSGLNDGLEGEVPPGTRWRYSLGPAWHLLKPLLVAASAMPLDQLTHEWLTGPADMVDTSWVERPGMAYLDGTPFEALMTTTRDLCQVGRVVIGRGEVSGARIVSEVGLMQLLDPSQELNAAYGMLWWLNGQRPHLLPLIDEPVDDVLFPGAPADAVAALGAMGQVCFVVPSRAAVVVRVGGAPPGPLALSGGTVSADIWPLLERTVFDAEAQPSGRH